jgi:hypothetical protein
MSHNLAFKKGSKIINFPYQTQIKLTKHVLACRTNDERIRLIKYQMDVDSWPTDAIDEMLTTVLSILNDDGVRFISN